MSLTMSGKEKCVLHFKIKLANCKKFCKCQFQLLCIFNMILLSLQSQFYIYSKRRVSSIDNGIVMFHVQFTVKDERYHILHFFAILHFISLKWRYELFNLLWKCEQISFLVSSDSCSGASEVQILKLKNISRRWDRTGTFNLSDRLGKCFIKM